MSDEDYGILRITRYSEAHPNGGGLKIVPENADRLILSKELVNDAAAGTPIDFVYSADGGKTICFRDDFGLCLTYEIVGRATTDSGYEGIEAIKV